MTADIRTAALALLNELGGLPDELEQQHIDAARAVIRVVTPTREQIAEACEGYLATRFTDPRHPQLEFVTEDSFGCADAILALKAGLAEENHGRLPTDEGE